jgi:hypothetical protein
LSPLATYYIPKDGPLQSYKVIIDTLHILLSLLRGHVNFAI